MDTTVQEVQRRLIALGYSVESAGADGVLGRNTIAALSKFQADLTLEIQYPGTIGAKTLAALGLDKRPALPPWISLAQSKMGLNEVGDNSWEHIRWQEVFKPVYRIIFDPGQDVCEIDLRIVGMELGSLCRPANYAERLF
jgi:peptidoglycan hydrolase-like protein with peptidoglycan-binding domain